MVEPSGLRLGANLDILAHIFLTGSMPKEHKNGTSHDEVSFSR